MFHHNPFLEYSHPEVFTVAQCYNDLREVFNKAKATSLPPHHPYDCCIDLLPGAPPPKGRLYSASASETLAMREYIQSSLKAGIIHPSLSRAGVGFFFVDKKDKTLQPSIDYIGLKNRVMR